MMDPVNLRRKMKLAIKFAVLSADENALKFIQLPDDANEIPGVTN